MPTWIIVVILLSIAATAFLASVLQRINAPKTNNRRHGDAMLADGGSGKRDNDSAEADSGGGGGGDGGGD